VDGGYTQQDVQQLAHCSDRCGINTVNPPNLKPEWQQLIHILTASAFESMPARTRFSGKSVAATHQGQGLGEVEEVRHLIVNQPACARFIIAAALAGYFVTTITAATVERWRRLSAHRRDIAATLRTMFLARNSTPRLAGKFKDPMRFVVWAVRFAYDGRRSATLVRCSTG